jgi:hypothetical protein
MSDSPQPDLPQPNPPVPDSTPATPQAAFYVWVEENAFRATALVSVDDPGERETLRDAGRIVHRLILQASSANGTAPGAPSVVRAQMAAIAADLRYLQGYCNKIVHLGFEPTLDPEVQALSRFAMELFSKLHDMRNQIAEVLLPSIPPAEQPVHSSTPQEPKPQAPPLTRDRLITG